MQRRNMFLILGIAAMLLLSVWAVAAATPGEADIKNVADKGEYTYTSADTVSLEAGNITYADVETNMSTYRWAGLYGNVSGNIVLGDSSNNIMYQWTAAGKLVYASTAASIAWSSLADASTTNVTGIDTWLAGAYSDNYTNTFTGASESIGSNIFTTVNSDYAQSNGGAGWKTYSLWDTSALVWAAPVVDAGQAAYDGTTAQYQMVIPEDGTAGNTATTAYNLWVELV